MTSIALEDIWDAPIALSSHPDPYNAQEEVNCDDNAVHLPNRPHSSLFLASDSEDEDVKSPIRQGTRIAIDRPDIAALFDDLDDDPEANFQELAPSLDIDALRRQADAENAKMLGRTAQAASRRSTGEGTNDSADDKKGKTADMRDKDGGKEKRKPLPKLDEARLLGPDGFPALVKQAKNFKPRGKGHEVRSVQLCSFQVAHAIQVSDLNRLLQVYQFWTHKMYPKTQFRGTVQRVEKLCHSKRMHVRVFGQTVACVRLITC